MANRSVNPVPQPQDSAGDTLVDAKMFYFESGTNVPLTTFADSLLTIANSHPVLLDAAGRLPNVFFEGSAKQRLTATILGVADALVWERDPVGSEASTGEFALWNPLIIYDIPDKAKGSDAAFYISIDNANQSNDPTTPSPTKWSEIRFIGVYNASESYSIGDVIQETTGLLWKSVVNSNVGNTPNTDNGTNWLPAVDGSKITEIITLEASTTTVIPHTGGGALTALRINELRDDNSGYTLPLANSVSANQIITINLPTRYATGAIVTRSGSDTIEGLTSDTSITFSGATSITLTSDGSSEWTL